MVDKEEEWADAVRTAIVYEPLVLAEKKIAGREFSVGVMEGRALPPIEIIPLTGFYDYKNKYQKGLTEEVCPAQLDPKQTQKIGEYAVTVHAALRLGSYSRIDFILGDDGELLLPRSQYASRNDTHQPSPAGSCANRAELRRSVR